MDLLLRHGTDGRYALIMRGAGEYEVAEITDEAHSDLFVAVTGAEAGIEGLRERQAEAWQRAATAVGETEGTFRYQTMLDDLVRIQERLVREARKGEEGFNSVAVLDMVNRFRSYPLPSRDTAPADLLVPFPVMTEAAEQGFESRLDRYRERRTGVRERLEATEAELAESQASRDVLEADLRSVGNPEQGRYVVGGEQFYGQTAAGDAVRAAIISAYEEVRGKDPTWTREVAEYNGQMSLRLHARGGGLTVVLHGQTQQEMQRMEDPAEFVLDMGAVRRSIEGEVDRAYAREQRLTAQTAEWGRQLATPIKGMAAFLAALGHGREAEAAVELSEDREIHGNFTARLAVKTGGETRPLPPPA